MKAVEKDANGSFKVESYPSQTLSQADEIYDAVVNGIADIGITAQGYTNGCFPMSQIVELPGVASSVPEGPGVLQTLYDDGQIAGEHDDTHVLFMFTTGPGCIHTRETDVQTLDLEGLWMVPFHRRGGQHPREHGRRAGGHVGSRNLYLHAARGPRWLELSLERHEDFPPQRTDSIPHPGAVLHADLRGHHESEHL